MTRADLIRAGPYRFFFPLGMVCGLLGVGHWLAWSSGWLKESNTFFHTSMQAEGFLACFVVGFLMTALPRFLGTAIASTAEIIFPASAAIAFIGASLASGYRISQVAFLVLLLSTLIFGLRRIVHRAKNPPDSFVLNLFGLVQGIAGPVLILAGDFGQRPVLMQVGRQMLQIGFLLCLVLGIGGYLTPFLMGYADDPSCDPGIRPDRRRWALAGHTLTGLVILGSFIFEPHAARLAAGLRAFFVTAHLMIFAKIARPIRRRRTPVYFFWISSWLVAAGLIGEAVLPDYRIAMLHLTFIGGFSLMIVSFALNVIFSHGADPRRLDDPIRPLWIIGIGILSSMIMRVAADFDAWHYQMWIHAASGTWFLAGLFWLVYVFPKLWQFPPEGRPITSEYAGGL